MSDTPRTDNELHELSYYETRRGRKYEEHFPYIEPEFARTLERELAAVTAERDRMRPVVEAAQNFRRPGRMAFWDGVDAINEAVDAYESQK